MVSAGTKAMAVGASIKTANNGGGTSVISLKDRAAWKAALGTKRPVLAHLNADTTWLLQLPVPANVPSTSLNTPSPSPKQRSRYNILIDPWLQGPQSDVASWFSTQWHVVPPTVQTMEELTGVLAEQEEGGQVDCVAISHEFTDHCHEATLLELAKNVPVVATEKAADLIRSWKHFDAVITTPGFGPSTKNYKAWQDVLASAGTVLPPWLGIGRVITQGNALYYHSAVIITFDLDANGPANATRSTPEAVIYSPHGIKGPDLACVQAAGIKTLALLHGLHDVRIWMTAQLNLGALNGIQAVRASGARYWVATHDEAKRGGGFISWLLRRTTYSLRDAVEADSKVKGTKEGSEYEFVELGSGDGMLLAQF